MIALLSLILSFSHAQILTFEQISKELSKTPNPSNHSQKKSETKKEGIVDKVLGSRALRAELKETKKKLESYQYMAKLQMSGPVILKDKVINEADLIGAQNIVTIYATATPSKVILSNFKGADIPSDSKIVCRVFTKYKRVCGSCERLIINGEGHDISAELYNRDGSPCAVGELSDDGEEYLIGVGISELARGALAVSQSTNPTLLGNIVENTTKNQLNVGLQNVGSEATELFKEEYKTREPIVRLKRNSDVAIFFNKGLSL